jgi:hypothetical protein
MPWGPGSRGHPTQSCPACHAARKRGALRTLYVREIAGQNDTVGWQPTGWRTVGTVAQQATPVMDRKLQENAGERRGTEPARPRR